MGEATEMSSLLVLEVEIKVLAGPHSLRRLQGESVPRLSQLLVAASIPWFMATSLQSLSHWPHHRLLFCVHLCQISLCLPLIRPLEVAFRAHQDSLLSQSLQFNHICKGAFAK